MRTNQNPFWTHTRYWQSVLVWFVLIVLGIDAALVVIGQVQIGAAVIGPVPLLVVFFCIWRLALPWFRALDRYDD